MKTTNQMTTEKDEKIFLNEMYSAALERTIRRLWILCILLILALAGTVAAWIYNENQYVDEVTTTTIESDAADGGDAFGIIGDNNEVQADGTR